jgi:hypothetical protein
MLDFGSPLPFNYVADRTDESWCVYYCRLASEADAGAHASYGPEMWAYFVWRPRDASQSLGEPECWGYTDEVPHEQIFVHVRREPMYSVCQIEADLVQTARTFYRAISLWPLSKY